MNAKLQHVQHAFVRFIAVLSILLTVSQLLGTRGFAQSSVPENKIPKNLEIIIRSGGGWGASSRLIIREDRVVETSSIGGLPKSTSLTRLMGLIPRRDGQSIKDYQKEMKRLADNARKAAAKLTPRVTKKTLRLILKKLVELRFAEMNPELMCVNSASQEANYVTDLDSKGISISFDGFTMSLSAYSGCGPADGSIVEQRQRFYELYDFIIASVANVRKTEVPWRSTEERSLRRFLKKGELPPNLEITGESDDAGLGARVVIKPDRTLESANYSMRNVIVLDGVEIADTLRTDSRVKKTRMPKALKNKVSKKVIRSILERFANDGFFNFDQRISGDFDVSGPRKTTTIAISFRGIQKRVTMNGRCMEDLGQPREKSFCGLFFLIQESTKGVWTKQIDW